MPNHTWVMGLLLSCCGLLCGDQLEAVTINFHPRAKVNRPFIYLGDIATITAEDSKVHQIYANAKLAPAPPGGENIILEFETIRNRLIALGLSTGEVEFTGQTTIAVETAREDPEQHALIQRGMHGRVMNRAAGLNDEREHRKQIIDQILRREIRTRLNVRGEELIELKFDVHQADLERLTGTTFLDWEVNGWSERLEERQYLLMSGKTERVGQIHIPVECQIKMPPKVGIVNHTLPVGHVITASDVSWIYSTDRPGGIEAGQIIGMETKRLLRAGTVVRIEDIQTKPYVRNRDLVNVYSKYGNVSVKATMRALETGGLGEIVALASLDGKQRFRGMVTGYHEAEVVESEKTGKQQQGD